MAKRQVLSAADLRTLLMERFNTQQSKEDQLRIRLEQALGTKLEEEKPEVIAIINKIKYWMSDLIARRLKRNRHTTPLLSARDYAKFVPIMIDEITKLAGTEFDDEERKISEKFMKAMFNDAFKAVNAMVPHRQNIYKEYWRWIKTVLDLAAERGVQPTELFAHENSTDEIVRRMFKKKQFVALSKKAGSKFMDAEVMKKVIFEPMLEMLDKGDEEFRRKMEQELEEVVMPELREIVKKANAFISAWIDEEVERIYETA